MNQLNQALIQSGWTGSMLTGNNWRYHVRQRVEQLNWQENIVQDIQAFVIDTDWEAALSQDSLVSLLS